MSLKTSMLNAGGSISKMWGGLGIASRGAIIGGGLGAGYGAMSSDTSVLGGALAGAGMGAAGGFGYANKTALRGAFSGGMDGWKAGRAFDKSFVGPRRAGGLI